MVPWKGIGVKGMPDEAYAAGAGGGDRAQRKLCRVGVEGREC